MTIWTDLCERRAATGTVSESGGDAFPALWARFRNRIPKDEIQNESDHVRNKDGRQHPHARSHSAPLGVTVHVPEQHDVHKHQNRNSEGECHSRDRMPEPHVPYKKEQACCKNHGHNARDRTCCWTSLDSAGSKAPAAASGSFCLMESWVFIDRPLLILIRESRAKDPTIERACF